MDELAALAMLDEQVSGAGDDAAVVDGHVLTTDMLHEQTDFPSGVTRYTAGWRAVGASLSDIAAMGAEAIAAVAVYAAPAFDEFQLRDFVDGAMAVCERVDATYVGGDLDTHREFTVSTTALGRANRPVYRSGAREGDAVYVTGTLGRSAAALELFEREEVEEANELFRFEPRVRAGLVIESAATAMIDSSDGLARSLHQLASASDCGFAVESERIPVDAAVLELTADAERRTEMSYFFGEDFELVLTAPPEPLEAVRAGIDTEITRIGTVTDSGVLIDDEPLENRGYAHGGS